MADTRHTVEPVEGDGINYRGIVWSAAVLVAIITFCQVLIVIYLGLVDRHRSPTEVRAFTAEPAGEPRLEAGRVVPGGAAAPGPAMLVEEPVVLEEYRRQQSEALETYGWADQGLQTVRIPIERAKELLLERGLPAREIAAPGDAPAPMSETTP